MRGGDKVTYNEITQILKSMVIIVDDREKDTPLCISGSHRSRVLICVSGWISVIIVLR